MQTLTVRVIRCETGGAQARLQMRGDEARAAPPRAGRADVGGQSGVWIERSAQIGQTGETISPRLYIGLGVSGAIHHTSGIQGAGTIVAVCDDSEAPIFEMADFGVVGDVADVVPQLVDELARLRG